MLGTCTTQQCAKSRLSCIAQLINSLLFAYAHYCAKTALSASDMIDFGGFFQYVFTTSVALAQDLLSW